MSRRLVYWQAYLHKTSLVAELILTRLKRAKELTLKGIILPCSDPQFFLQNKITLTTFDTETLDLFSIR
jgi:HD superfamily phosphohydrolase